MTSTDRGKLKAANDVRRMFEDHADFVWRVLARAGVSDSHLEDALQEVFIIVSNKLSQLEAGTRPTTWLYGIAVRVAANHRRKIRRRREELGTEPDEPVTMDEAANPETLAELAEARIRLAALLDQLAPEQRIVFEMFELEEQTCPAIAEQLGIPLGTVYTRLRTARMTVTSKAEETR